MGHPHTPRGDDVAGRIRAAAAYADFNRKQLGEALGYSVETVSALFAGDKSADAELRGRIAAACGVPIEFLELGFAPLERPVTDIERRVLELETDVGQVVDQVDGLHDVAALLQVLRDRAQAGELGDDLAAIFAEQSPATSSGSPAGPDRPAATTPEPAADHPAQTAPVEVRR